GCGGGGGVVGVEQVGAPVAVTRQVHLPDPVGRQTLQVVLRTEAVVDAAHVDVVHVQEDAAVGAFRDGGEEGPLGHRGVREGEVALDVFQQDATPEPGLHSTHALDDVVQRLVG